jgi:hypothetical protein
MKLTASATGGSCLLISSGSGDDVPIAIIVASGRVQVQQRLTLAPRVRLPAHEAPDRHPVRCGSDHECRSRPRIGRLPRGQPFGVGALVGNDVSGECRETSSGVGVATDPQPPGMASVATAPRERWQLSGDGCGRISVCARLRQLTGHGWRRRACGVCLD